ncbi:glutathione S-transferase [Acidovorax sp. FG27]|uniref:glutathione S-transferase n=1 Tax=Acidovorax sp. FG27 TaxID=3133652 RepID=UPI0030E8B4BC
MQLIGMLDSPYVRRVAIGLRLLGLPYEHRPLSVFSTFGQFQAVNPVVKAPTLVTQDGTVLMDSTLILQWAEAQPQARAGLTPASADGRLRDLRRTGLALAACEKTVQIVYERHLRPPEKQHGPWLERVGGQLEAAYAALEADVAAAPASEPLHHGGLCAAVAWSFTQFVLPGTVPPALHPALAQFTARAEGRPEFTACPQQGC